MLAYNQRKIIPAPLMDIQKEYQTSEDGTRLGTVFQITLKGTLVAYRGSPISTLTAVSGNFIDTFWVDTGEPPDEVLTVEQGLAAIQRKQEALRRLFSTDGLVFEAQTPDGSSVPFKCNPRIKGITFEAGTWWDRCEYTISMEADKCYGLGTPETDFAHSQYIRSASENWQLEEGEVPYTWRLTHTISAAGKRFFNSAGTLTQEAWEQARDFVMDRAGYSSAFGVGTQGVQVPNGHTAFNWVRSEQVDELGGTFTLTENFLLASGNATETFTVSSRQDLNRKKTVTINGKVQGLFTGLENYGQKYTNASAFFNNVTQPNLLSRAQNYAGSTLNPVAASFDIIRNPSLGEIEYTWVYDNRPCTLISGAIAESIEVTDNNSVDVIGVVPVLGRLAGPVLQSLNQKSERTRQVAISATLAAPSGCLTAAQLMARRPETTDIVAQFVPPYTRQLYITEDRISYNMTEGTYSRNVSWSWE